MIGIILAGGVATRMGGGDKGLVAVAGVPILARVIAVMAPQCDGLVLNANGDPARFAAFGLPIVGDGTPEPLGPLAGILAGLDWIATHRPNETRAVTAPTDTPFLPHDLVARLSASNAPIACAHSGGRAHPTAACWSIALRHPLRIALRDQGLRKVGRFLDDHAAATVDWGVSPHDPFLNANTPADLALAETIAACSPHPPSV